jgi:hypothetical protein
MNGSRSDANETKLLAEYEQAQSIAQHGDAVFHEVAAIAWGANTLLLGFILEVDCNSANQRLVVVSALIGLVISAYVPVVMNLIKIGQPIAYSVCREIEDDLQLPHRLNNRINDKYPPGRGQKAVWIISGVFALAWVAVIANALHCLWESRALAVLTASAAIAGAEQSIPPTDWTLRLSYANTGIQILVLLGLVWYTLETRRIRKTSQKQFALSQDQVEATLRPCLSLSTTARNAEDAILAMDDTDSTVIVRCPEGLVQVENIGVGPATNIRYEFSPADPEGTLAHPTGYVAGLPVSGTFLIPVARTLIAGHNYNCRFDYESVGHRRYRTRVALKNLVITDVRFEAFL